MGSYDRQRVTRELLDDMQRLQWGIENDNSQRYKKVKRSSPNPGAGQANKIEFSE